MKQSQKPKKEEDLQLKIEWRGLKESPLVFANSILVQSTPHEFIISFGQVHPPVILGDIDNQVRQMKTIESQVVVRIVLPPTRVPELIDVLSRNYGKFVERISVAEKKSMGGEETK